MLAFSLGLTVDEAWITQGIETLAKTGSYATNRGAGATTTGGVYALLQVIISKLSGGSLPAMRLLSAFALAALLWEIRAWARAAGISRTGSLVATSTLVGVPGTLILASTAYSVILATWLAVASASLPPHHSRAFERDS